MVASVNERDLDIPSGTEFDCARETAETAADDDYTAGGEAFCTDGSSIFIYVHRKIFRLLRRYRLFNRLVMSGARGSAMKAGLPG